MRVTQHVHVLVVIIYLFIPRQMATTVTLLDTRQEESLGWTTYSQTEDGEAADVQWRERRTNRPNGETTQVYMACGNLNTTNWLRMPYISREQANTLWLEIKFTMRKCNEHLERKQLQPCKESFKLLYYEAESDFANDVLPSWDTDTYQLVDIIAATHTWQDRDERIVNSATRTVDIKRRGVYFAFQVQGSCITIVSVRIYYIECPSVTLNFASFAKTPVGAGQAGIVKKAGVCVTSAAIEEPPSYLCKADGQWSGLRGGCKCLPGYQPEGDKKCTVACESFELENGEVNPLMPHGYQHNETVYLTCNPGYELIGKSHSTCYKDLGGWDQNRPRCGIPTWVVSCVAVIIILISITTAVCIKKRAAVCACKRKQRRSQYDPAMVECDIYDYIDDSDVTAAQATTGPDVEYHIYEEMSGAVTMADGDCTFPPWDPRNKEEDGMLYFSSYRDLLRRDRVQLRDKLQVTKLWAHLQQLKVLRQNDEERIRVGAARCDAVERLLDHVTKSCRWQYHGLMRALALTGQAGLIPEGGLESSVYLQGTMDKGDTKQSPYGPFIRTKISTVSKEVAETILDDQDKNYRMSSKPRGKAIVLSCDNFYSLLKDRKGSDKDSVNLNLLFTDLGFTVETWTNLTVKGIRKRIQREQQLAAHHDYDAFVMCVMSHGKKETIYDCENTYMSITDELIMPFNAVNAPGLANKPKMFFIQACQAEKRPTTEAAPCAEVFVPPVRDFVTTTNPGTGSHQMADILVVQSTVEGYLSYVNTERGSFFMRDLVSVFRARCHEDHVADMMIEVTKKLNSRDIDDRKCKQVCSTKSTLTRRVYLLPGYSE